MEIEKVTLMREAKMKVLGNESCIDRLEVLEKRPRPSERKNLKTGKTEASCDHGLKIHVRISCEVECSSEASSKLMTQSDVL